MILRDLEVLISQEQTTAAEEESAEGQDRGIDKYFFIYLAPDYGWAEHPPSSVLHQYREKVLDQIP